MSFPPSLKVEQATITSRVTDLGLPYFLYAYHLLFTSGQATITSRVTDLVSPYFLYSEIFPFPSFRIFWTARHMYRLGL